MSRLSASNLGLGPIPTLKKGCVSASILQKKTSTICPKKWTTLHLFALLDLPKPALRDRDWTPLSPALLEDGAESIFAAIHAGDFLVHHPYDSFDATVEHFISSAADDPQTVSIKMTAYRIGRRYTLRQIIDSCSGTGKPGCMRHGDQGALRRRAESTLGSGVGARWSPRYVWNQRPEDPRQNSASGAQKKRAACAAMCTSVPAITM